MLGQTASGWYLLLQIVLLVFAGYGFLMLVESGLTYLRFKRAGQSSLASILLITHNNEQQIEGIIRRLFYLNCRNVVGQPVPYELVVVDASSNDNTYGIIERLARGNNSLQLLRVGESKSAYQEGLAACRGEVVYLLDLMSPGEVKEAAENF